MQNKKNTERYDATLPKDFDKEMKEAAKDKAFLKRTMYCNDDFKYVDAEINRIGKASVGNGSGN